MEAKETSVVLVIFLSLLAVAALWLHWSGLVLVWYNSCWLGLSSVEMVFFTPS